MYIKRKSQNLTFTGPFQKACQYFLQLYTSFGRAAKSKLLVTCDSLQSGRRIQDLDILPVSCNKGKDQVEEILFMGQSILPCLSFQVMEKPWNVWATDCLFSIPQDCSPSECPKLSLPPDGRQVDFDVEDMVRSTWQPEVKHQLNFGPWGKEVVPVLLQRVKHGHYAEESHKPFFVYKALGASVTLHYNKPNFLCCWWPVIGYMIATLSTALSPPKIPFFPFLFVHM